jgi:hypothetical protein
MLLNLRPLFHVCLAFVRRTVDKALCPVFMDVHAWAPFPFEYGEIFENRRTVREAIASNGSRYPASAGTTSESQANATPQRQVAFR